MPGRLPVPAIRRAHRLVGGFRHRRPRQLAYGIKALTAALLAWALAGPAAPEGRAYVAVATALLMVNASTVYRSVTNALQSIAAKVVGLVLALMTVRLLGPTAGAIAVIALLTVLAGPRRTSDGRLQVASTAVVALAAMAGDPMGGLVSPVLQTLAGAVVGIAVNALVLPPLHVDDSDSAVRTLAHAVGELLHDMGTGLARGELRSKAPGWLHRGRQLEKHLAFTQEQVRQADESLRWNARCVTHGSHDVTYGELFSALRGVSLQVRGIARTLADNAYDHPDRHLGLQFLERYAETLQLAGTAVRSLVDDLRTETDPADPHERLRTAIEGALAWHETLTDLIGQGTLTKPGAWHVYGSLMTDVERLLADLDYAGAHRT
ncbi:aromatic acid exporter family protein [Streptomyces sp. RY43-2]|uniref:Aromatic acid exporter family protein n=1 Tax=Streptomyces macrolidinus TaxID=2952607 RepID=A0ABT0ZLE6_9ACTN|nr:aromatic acid exporter family protein [Streptomyces macrolidinus]MCN9244396.1 aromatic acid exporter family protein [Streptomyces macrolidinus]